MEQFNAAISFIRLNFRLIHLFKCQLPLLAFLRTCADGSLFITQSQQRGDACKTLDTQRGAQKGASENYLARQTPYQAHGHKTLFIERISFQPTIFHSFSDNFVLGSISRFGSEQRCRQVKHRFSEKNKF
jgi:hypothetical protein